MAPKSKTDEVKASAERRKVGVKKTQPTLVKGYLIAYNLASCVAWGAILALLVWHVVDPEATPSATKGGAWSSVQSFLARVLPAHGQLAKHKATAAVRSRLEGGYAAVGPLTAVVQTAAVLEVVHAALGWVRSPVGTTAAQVASRLWTVWAVVEQFETARASAGYSTMVFAWSLTEVVRYLFYALSLLNLAPAALTWLRYSTFLPLYPLGAGSEAYLSFLTLPALASLPVVGDAVAKVQAAAGLKKASFLAGKLSRGWSAFDLARGGLVFVIWPPALYVMYTYMVSQRKKALGGGAKVGTQKKRV